MKATNESPLPTGERISGARPGLWEHESAIAVSLTLLVFCLLAPALHARPEAGGTAPTTSLVHRTLSVDGREREYAVYRPEGLADDAGSLLVLHGSGGDVQRIRVFTGHRFESLADQHGFRVIYPKGFEGNWNGCRHEAPTSANRLDVDDVGFLHAVLDRETPAGGRRVVFGFSGGGHMAFRLALEAPDTVSGIAAAGANLPIPENNDCSPVGNGPLPAVFLVNGTEDPINPYDGGPVIMPAALGGAGLGAVRSSRDTARYFAARNGHSSSPHLLRGADRDGDPATRSVWSMWTSPGRPAVALVTIEGGGHTIPQPGVRFPELAGPHSADLDAPLAAWRFMSGELPLDLQKRGQSPFFPIGRPKNGL